MAHIVILGAGIGGMPCAKHGPQPAAASTEQDLTHVR